MSVCAMSSVTSSGADPITTIAGSVFCFRESFWIDRTCPGLIGTSGRLGAYDVSDSGNIQQKIRCLRGFHAASVTTVLTNSAKARAFALAMRPDGNTAHKSMGGSVQS